MELNSWLCEGDCAFGASHPTPMKWNGEVMGYLWPQGSHLQPDAGFCASDFLSSWALLCSSLGRRHNSRGWWEWPHLGGALGIFPKKIFAGLCQYLSALLACHDLCLSLYSVSWVSPVKPTVAHRLRYYVSSHSAPSRCPMKVAMLCVGLGE